MRTPPTYTWSTLLVTVAFHTLPLCCVQVVTKALPLMMGNAPVPYAPTLMGAAAVPEEPMVISPRYTPARWKRIWSPGRKVYVDWFTRAMVFQGVEVEVPLLVSLPVG